MVNNETQAKAWHTDEADHAEDTGPDGTAGPLNEVEDGSFARAILMGLQTRTNGTADTVAMDAHRRHKPGRTNAADPFRPNVYQGTVDAVTIAERRAKNKIGRRQRVANTRRARR